MNAAEIAIFLTTLITLVYFPLNVLQGYFLVRNRKFLARQRATIGPPIPGRRLLVMITTVGQARKVVLEIIRTLWGYGLPLQIAVLAEDDDDFPYPGTTFRVRVPRSYRTPNGSQRKMRAQHYGAGWLARSGFGSETYVVHLDDDSIPSQAYLEYVMQMQGVIGQGAVRLRAHGYSLWATLADMARVTNCACYCTFFNSLGKPMEVHGEGMVIRADLESKFGWDFGTYGAEDLMMGQQVVAAGYRFENIPEHIFIAPPITARDFYKQRRRWFFSAFWSFGKIYSIRKNVVRWLVYRYSLGWLGCIGLILMILDLLVIRPHLPTAIWVMGTFNLVSYFGFYQFGAWKTDRHRYSWKMALLQIPVSVFECAVMIRCWNDPPDRGSFDMIRKI